MAASTSITAALLFYSSGLSTSAAEIWAGPTTAQRGIVTATYVINNSTADAAATVTHRMSTAPVDVNVVPAATIDANTSVVFGPLVLSSTTSQQSIRAFGGTAGSIQLAGYGYLETI